MAQQIRVLALLLCLIRTSVGLWPWELSFCSKMKLSHLVEDEAAQQPLQGHPCPARPCHESCHYSSNSPTCVSVQNAFPVIFTRTHFQTGPADLPWPWSTCNITCHYLPEMDMLSLLWLGQIISVTGQCSCSQQFLLPFHLLLLVAVKESACLLCGHHVWEEIDLS